MWARSFFLSLSLSHLHVVLFYVTFVFSSVSFANTSLFLSYPFLFLSLYDEKLRDLLFPFDSDLREYSDDDLDFESLRESFEFLEDTERRDLFLRFGQFIFLCPLSSQMKHLPSVPARSRAYSLQSLAKCPGF